MISAWKRSSLASLAAKGLKKSIKSFTIPDPCTFYRPPDSEQDAGAECEVVLAGRPGHEAGEGDPGSSIHTDYQ